MDQRLMIIYPYKECGTMIRQLSPGLPYSPLLIDGENFDDALKRTLDSLVNRYYVPDVIIGRGVVTTYASKLFPTASIVRIDPDSLDILYPLKQARAYGDTVGILTYPQQGIEDNIGILKDILDFRTINTYLFETADDIRQQVSMAKRDGMHSIIGGGTLGLEVASSHNIPAVFIEISRSNIRKAIAQAVSIIESLQKERQQLENISAIVNCMSEGLLATYNNRVLLSNSSLNDILGVSVADYYSKDVKELNARVHSFVKNSNGPRRDIITIRDKKYLVEKLDHKISRVDSILVFRNISELQDTEAQLRKSLHPTKCSAKYTFKDIVGRAPKIGDAIRNASICSLSDADILITGETGVGKELFAQGMHNHSPRRDKPFVAVNCGAIPEQLLESELFGYIEGAFSGARKGGKIGLFELAHRGTIFLDEIDSLPITLQSKLLRVIQEKTLRRVGSETEIISDIRIISATNKDLASMIRTKEFRPDLFYRISTLTINVPNLRDRPGDIEMLANYFIDLYAAKYKKEVPPLAQRQLDALIYRPWMGNVRELENVMHRYVIMHGEMEKDRLIEESVAGSGCTVSAIETDKETINIKKDKLERMERAIIISYLDEYRWNRKAVADKLGISRCSLWRKLKEE